MRIRLSMPCLTRRPPFHQQIDWQVTDDIAFKGDDVACFLDHFANVTPLQTVLLHDGRKCWNIIPATSMSIRSCDSASMISTSFMPFSAGAHSQPQYGLRNWRTSPMMLPQVPRRRGHGMQRSSGGCHLKGGVDEEFFSIRVADLHTGPVFCLRILGEVTGSKRCPAKTVSAGGRSVENQTVAGLLYPGREIGFRIYDPPHTDDIDKGDCRSSFIKCHLPPRTTGTPIQLP